MEKIAVSVLSQDNSKSRSPNRHSKVDLNQLLGGMSKDIQGDGGKISFVDVLCPSPEIMESFDERAR